MVPTKSWVKVFQVKRQYKCLHYKSLKYSVIYVSTHSENLQEILSQETDSINNINNISTHLNINKWINLLNCDHLLRLRI